MGQPEAWRMVRRLARRIGDRSYVRRDSLQHPDNWSCQHRSPGAATFALQTQDAMSRVVGEILDVAAECLAMRKPV
jgi:hypothetical protein